MSRTRWAHLPLLAVCTLGGVGVLALLPILCAPGPLAAVPAAPRALAPAGAASVGAVSALASTARPGATDPMGTNSRYYLVKSDELFLPSDPGPDVAVGWRQNNVFNVDTSLKASF